MYSVCTVLNYKCIKNRFHPPTLGLSSVRWVTKVSVYLILVRQLLLNVEPLYDPSGTNTQRCHSPRGR